MNPYKKVHQIDPLLNKETDYLIEIINRRDETHVAMFCTSKVCCTKIRSIYGFWNLDYTKMTNNVIGQRKVSRTEKFEENDGKCVDCGFKLTYKRRIL